MGLNRFCPRCGNDSGGQTSGNGKISLNDILTRQNIEYLVAAAGVLPLVLSILKDVSGLFSEVPLMGTVFKVLNVLLTIVVIAAEVGACAGAGILISKDRSLQSPSGYLAAGAALVSAFNVIMITAGGGGNFITFLLSLLTLAAAADMLSRVVFQKGTLADPIDIARDMGVYTVFIKQAADESRRQRAEQQQMIAQAQAANRMTASFFDGSGIELLGYVVLTVILDSITFGLASPWTTCMIVKWTKSHTVINGRRLTFTGKGGQLFLLFLKWVLLSVITLGIYSFFAVVDYLKWEASHTFFEDEHPAAGMVNNNSRFDGNTFEYIGYSIVTSIVNSLTLCIAFPWMCTILMNWQMSHYVISGRRLSFDGKGMQFLGTYIVCILLCAVTFGIYSPWAVVKLNKWAFAHTKEEAPVQTYSYT